MADDKPFVVSDSELVDVTDDEISDEVIEMPDGEVVDHDRIPIADDEPFIVSDSELVGVTDDEISDEVIEMPDDISDEEDENQETPSTPQKENEVNRKCKSNSTLSIREKVHNTLRKEMTQRMSENEDTGPKLNEDEIKQFACDTEVELYELFKDVGVKYKSRYRSLNFNIKDRKNLTLWQKICEKSITPKQLVQLSPEELASQELAEWRDNEVKQELELIKKSELDLLAANKTYVLKTHKGVKVMESKTAVSTDLDPNMPVEDVVTALNEPTVTEETPKSKPGNPAQEKSSIDSESENHVYSGLSRKRSTDTHSSHLKNKESKSEQNSKGKEERTRSGHTRSTSKERVNDTRESRRKARSRERSRHRSRSGVKSERRSKSGDSRSGSNERSTGKSFDV